MGVDLLDFFRGRRSWRQLALILDRLPLSSAYREAWIDDPEVAEAIASQPEPPSTGRPRLPLSEYDTHASLLADVLDRLGDVVSVLMQQNGGKPPKVPPAPRPETGVERARRRLEDKRHADLVAEVKAAQERWERSREVAVDASSE
jgi:hypothetical protein